LDCPSTPLLAVPIVFCVLGELFQIADFGEHSVALMIVTFVSSCHDDMSEMMLGGFIYSKRCIAHELVHTVL